MSVTVPAGASTGSVVVTNANGTSNGITFTVTNPPSISSLNPTSGVITTPITIIGQYFTGVQSVKFNDTVCTYTVDGPTQITATVPSGATTGNVVVTTTAGSSNGMAFTMQLSWTFAWRKTGLNSPRNACFDTNNVICIANSGANNVARFDTNGNQLSNITDGSFNGVVSVAVDANGNHYVACYNTKKIQKFDSNWANRVELISTTYDIRDVAAEYGSSIVVLESQSGTDGWVEVFNSSGVKIYGPWQIVGANTPLSIALSSDGNYVWIADSSANYVRKYSLAGIAQVSYSGLELGSGPFSGLTSIHVTSDGTIHVSESGNYRFQVFKENIYAPPSIDFLGKFTGTNGTGDGQFTYIRGIVSDSNGNVYTVDNTGNNLQKFTKN